MIVDNHFVFNLSVRSLAGVRIFFPYGGNRFNSTINYFNSCIVGPYLHIAIYPPYAPHFHISLIVVHQRVQHSKCLVALDKYIRKNLYFLIWVHWHFVTSLNDMKIHCLTAAAAAKEYNLFESGIREKKQNELICVWCAYGIEMHLFGDQWHFYLYQMFHHLLYYYFHIVWIWNVLILFVMISSQIYRIVCTTSNITLQIITFTYSWWKRIYEMNESVSGNDC